VSAAVNDLQVLDKNEQVLQQVDQLLQDAAPADSSTSVPQPQS
jgi:cell division septum initiation protein DivIVA